MPEVTIIYGEETRTITSPVGSLLGELIASTGLPLEQPCAGRGTCGKCKVLVEAGVALPDEIEQQHLTPGELALDNRLACRARLASDARVVLSPIVVYSNKNFRASQRYKSSQSPLGLAIDLGSTTVAAFLTILSDKEEIEQTKYLTDMPNQVCAGAASLNQQTVYGADVISRLAAATNNPINRVRLQRLALASINQAVDSLKLSRRVSERVTRVVIVGNVAMHHLLTGMPIDTLATMPFQPFDRSAIPDARAFMGGIFREGVRVSLPPLIGGFVGSDALACLAYFSFDQASAPMVAIDLGTNGEVMVTDGQRILTASTAAGPAFEGVNISCGTRAVDGAIVAARLRLPPEPQPHCNRELPLATDRDLPRENQDYDLQFVTINDEAPIGLTGSGLLSLVNELVLAGVIETSGRILPHPAVFAERIGVDRHGSRCIHLTHNSMVIQSNQNESDLRLSQWDVRELQKAKGAIRAATDILMSELGLAPDDLQRLILTGSFGGQIDIDAALNLGLIPPVQRKVVETIPNGAGFGAVMFLSDEGFAHSQVLARKAEQIDLDQAPDFIRRYVNAMVLAPFELE